MEKVKLSKEPFERLKISQCALEEFLLCLSSPAPAQPSKVIKNFLRNALEIQEPNIIEQRRVFVFNEWRFILDDDLSHLITCSRLPGRASNAKPKRRYRKNGKPKRRYRKMKAREGFVKDDKSRQRYRTTRAKVKRETHDIIREES